MSRGDFHLLIVHTTMFPINLFTCGGPPQIVFFLIVALPIRPSDAHSEHRVCIGNVPHGTNQLYPLHNSLIDF